MLFVITMKICYYIYHVSYSYRDPMSYFQVIYPVVHHNYKNVSVLQTEH